jgi:hypothetical protein
MTTHIESIPKLGNHVPKLHVDLAQHLDLAQPSRTTQRSYAVGFPPTVVEPGESCVVETWPQPLLFQIDMLMVSPDVQDDFLIEDVVVGTMSQFALLDANGGNPMTLVPAKACDPTDYKFPHEFFTKCRLGHKVFVKVKNTSNERKTFRGGLIGIGLFEA